MNKSFMDSFCKLEADSIVVNALGGSSKVFIR